MRLKSQAKRFMGLVLGSRLGNFINRNFVFALISIELALVSYHTLYRFLIYLVHSGRTLSAGLINFVHNLKPAIYLLMILSFALGAMNRRFDLRMRIILGLMIIRLGAHLLLSNPYPNEIYSITLLFDILTLGLLLRLRYLSS